MAKKSKIKIFSWNVNGIRAAAKKGFVDWMKSEQPDILGIQETKALPEQTTEIAFDSGYDILWNSAERKGYSGVAIFTKNKPLKVTNGIGVDCFDCEGRVILAEYEKFQIYNVYFPNGQKDETRLKYKLDFYDALLKHAEKRKKKKPVIITGDFNTAHTEIDLARPKANENTSGFMRIERDWVDKYLSKGYVDVFREHNPGLCDQYSWWSYRSNARTNNVGWRIDYFLVSSDFASRVTDAKIHADVTGSDHCPISIELTL